MAKSRSKSESKPKAKKFKVKPRKLRKLIQSGTLKLKVAGDSKLSRDILSTIEDFTTALDGYDRTYDRYKGSYDRTYDRTVDGIV